MYSDNLENNSICDSKGKETYFTVKCKDKTQFVLYIKVCGLQQLPACGRTLAMYLAETKLYGTEGESCLLTTITARNYITISGVPIKKI